jgi:hypothetical protein
VARVVSSTRALDYGLPEEVVMATTLQRVDYFYVTVRDLPGEAYKLLSILAELGVDLLAFTAIPIGPAYTQLAIFPADRGQFVDVARDAAIPIDGPHPALLARGDDRLGAFAEVHMKLFEANVNVYASSGVGDGSGKFGYLIYVRPEDYARAVEALGV